MNILIVGAQLGNKGAESMLYITVDELKKRFGDCNIFFATREEFDESKYAFKRLYYTNPTKKIALEGGVGNTIYEYVKMLGKILLGKKKKYEDILAVKKIIKNIDVMVDVSGFAIGNKWGKDSHDSYINNIRLAKKYNIPMYLMPQSFGPFDYGDKKIDSLLAENLKYPRVIFAREQDGKKELEKYNLSNVVVSTDLVLQNKGVNIQNVFSNQYKIEPIEMLKEKCVGIVPNRQCFKRGNEEKNIEIYVQIIDKLLEHKYNVIVFRHSREDLAVCEMIKHAYADNENVQLVSKEFSCFEYDEYVKQFDFIICSRFHGLVHAYRNSVPCIALGWAIKYKELLQNVNQAEYAFDITSENCENNAILEAIEYMIQNVDEERIKIIKAVKEIQEKNCFDVLEEDYRAIKNIEKQEVSE